ncbi:zinc finger protein 2-like [Entelurus aequoreus]|uniref:zinc finger protein 2-like n=1 Tax=Entelurus aequoreus TaxID=161455 RepID=UPI002B1DC219|nr:zinc finger protein 2-like [Entelurus aequoreus]
MDDYCYAKMATSAKREHERESAPPTSSKSPTEINTKDEDKIERVKVSNNIILETIVNPEKSVDEKLAEYVEECKERAAMIVSLKKAVEFTSEEMKECKSQIKKLEEQNKRLCKENNDLKEEMLGKSKRCAVCEEKTGPHVYINVQRIGDVQQLIGNPEEVSPQLGGSSTLKQETPQPPCIKKEEEELCITQEGECLLGREEADYTKFPLSILSVKTEDDEEKPQGDNLLAPLLDREAKDEVEEPLSSDTDCEGDMRTHTDNKHSECSTKKRGKTCLSCSVCAENFTKKSSLTEHMRTHSGEKTFKCSVCGKSFSQNSSLTRHMRTHTGERTCNCSVCGKSFSRNSSLTQHMRTHRGEKPCNCSVCGRSFSQNSNLTRHMRTHKGEKTCNCSVCGKSFSRNSNLTQHMRMHKGEKPCKCSVCGKRFSVKRTLTHHMRTHTGPKPFNCSVCGTSFSYNSSLCRHMRTHAGGKPLSCSVCCKRFTHNADVVKHIKTHTGK